MSWIHYLGKVRLVVDIDEIVDDELGIQIELPNPILHDKSRRRTCA